MEDTLPELPALQALESNTPTPVVRSMTPKPKLRPMIPPAAEQVEIEIAAPKEVSALEPVPDTSAAGLRLVAVPREVMPEASSVPMPPIIEAAPSEAVSEVKTAAQRLLSLDAFRGCIMLLMVSGGFGIPQLADKMPGTMWETLKPQFVHTEWAGFSLWDMIQPAFMFMVGVAMPFSYAKRLERGEGTFRLFEHALFRSIVLVLLGVLLSSNSDKGTHWIFTNVLSQIGLGYLVLFLLWRLGSTVQLLALIGIVVGYGAWFAYTEVPASALDISASKIASKDLLTGFFAHWNPHLNPAGLFDNWFLRLFPHDPAQVLNAQGYQTLNFVPALATMLLGLMTGRLLRSDRDHNGKLGVMILVGGLLVGLGVIANENVCPIVKKLWTPSWVLFSGGIVMWMLAAFYCAIEMIGVRALAMPFAVVGMNSIFAYVMSQLARSWIKDALAKHLGSDMFGGAFGPMVQQCSVLLVIWMLCWWLYRQRAFLRI